MINPKDKPPEFMLVSDWSIARPAGWKFLAETPLGYWFGSPDATVAQLRQHLLAGKEKAG